MSEDVRDPSRYRLWQMRHVLGLDAANPDGDTVQRFYRDAFARSVRLRGSVAEAIVIAAHADLIELAKWGPAEADEWCFATNERAESYAGALLRAHECETETPQQEWFREYMKRNPRKTLNAQEAGA